MDNIVELLYVTAVARSLIFGKITLFGGVEILNVRNRSLPAPEPTLYIIIVFLVSVKELLNEISVLTSAVVFADISTLLIEAITG